VKVLTIVGARPQFIKSSVVSVALKKCGIIERVVHTGQHYDFRMSQIFFDQLQLQPPDYNLEVGSGSHGTQTGEMLKKLEPVIQEESPDCVIVFGDTNTTLAGALVVAKLAVPFAHVEAGLRSFDRAMPEEINRVVTDHLATHNYAPTTQALLNLNNEGIRNGVEVVGDVMADLLMRTLTQLPALPESLSRLSLAPKAYGIVTVHRAANTDNRAAFERIISAIRSLPFPIIFPVHPRVRALVEGTGVGRDDNIRVTEPLGYVDMIALQRHARVILTDSGGMQKEAFLLATPCVTLRQETEWPETLVDGWNILAGSDCDLIVKSALRRPPSSTQPAPFGDGHAADRIARSLARAYSDAFRPNAIGMG